MFSMGSKMSNRSAERGENNDSLTNHVQECVFNPPKKRTVDCSNVTEGPDSLAYPAPVWASWLSWPSAPGRRSGAGTWWSHWWNKEIMADMSRCPSPSHASTRKCPEPQQSAPVSPLATCLGRCCWHRREWWRASWSWRPSGEAAGSCWPGCGAAGRIRPQLPACWTPPGSSSSCFQHEENGCSPGWWFSTSDGKSSLARSSGPVTTDDAKVQVLHSWHLRSSGFLTHLTSVFIKDGLVLSIVLSSIIPLLTVCFIFMNVFPNVQLSLDSKGCSHQSKHQELSLLPTLPSVTQPQRDSETHPVISNQPDSSVGLNFFSNKRAVLETQFFCCH